MGVFEDIKKGPSTSSSGGGVFAQIKKRKVVEDTAKNRVDNQEARKNFGPINDNLMQSPTIQRINDLPSAAATPAPVSNYESRKNDKSRNIPVIGGVFKMLDKLSDTKVQHVIADVGQTLYTPGGGAANVASMFGAAEKGIAKVAPNLVNSSLGRVTQKVASSAVTAFPEGVGQYQAQGGDDVKEALKQGAISSVVGGGLGALGGSVGEMVKGYKNMKLEDSFNKMFPTYEQAAKNRNVQSIGNAAEVAPKQTGPILGLPEPKSAIMARELQNRSVLPANTNAIRGQGDIAAPEILQLNASPQYDAIQRIKAQQTLSLPEASQKTVSEFNRRNGNVQPTNTNPIYGQGNVADPLGLPQGEYVNPTRLKVNNPNETLDYVMTKIKPEVMSIIEAPTRRDLLIQYVQKNTQIPVNEIHNIPMEALKQMGQDVEDSLHGNMKQIAYDVAAKHGHDLPALLEGQAPTLRAKLAKDAQSKVYGVPAEKVNIPRPKFNKEVTGQAAAPKQGLAFKRDPKVQEANKFVETTLQQQQRIAKQVKDAADRKKISELNKPVIGRAAMPETKTKRVLGARNEVAVTAEVRTKPVAKPKVSPVNGTVIKKETVFPISRVGPTINKPFEPVTFKNKPDLVDTTKQKSSEKVVGERGFAQTLKSSDKTPQEFKDILDSKYTKLRNVDAVTQANKRISKSVDDAEAYVMGNSKHSPEKVATAGRLIDEFNKAGNYQKAVSVAEKVSKELTEAGQTVQAAAIFNRLTPEGALIRAQRKVTKINEEATKLGKPVEITAKNAQDIKEAAEAIQVANASKERAADVIDIMDKLKAKQTITEAERAVVQDFIKDAQQYVRTKEKPIRERPVPSEMGEKRVKDKVLSFLDAQEAKARERMAARRGRMNSLPLDEYADMAIIAAAKIAKGGIKLSDISAELIKDFGEGIKPHLAGVFEKAHDLIRNNAKRISKEVVSQAERIAENYIKKNEAHIKPEDVDFVRGLAKKVSDLSGASRNAASQDLQAVLSSFERAGLGKKIAATQYIAMLLNPLTQVKNIVGNELLFRLNRLSRTLQTPADMIYSGITGKDRMITIKSGPATWDNFFAPTRDYLSGLTQGAKAGWRGVNIEGLTTSYDISGQAFRSKLNPLTYLEKTLGATMKGFDYAAFNRAVQQRLRETAYLDAVNKGIKGKANQTAHIDKYMANLDDNIAEIAHEFGKKITLQDTTLLSNKLQGMRGGLNQLSTFGLTKDFGVGSLVLPFAKTPANLLMRAIDYSPAGFGKALLQVGQILLKKETDLTRADVIQSVTDAILGTGMTGVGLWLASKGVLKGETNSDRDVRELEKLSGITQYQLNASAIQRMIGAMVNGNMKDINEAAKIKEGDSLYQYEWAQPSSIPLALGANIFKERKDAKQLELKGQKSDSLIKQTIDVSTGAANTLFNTSVLQGLQQAFDFNYGEDNKIKSFLTNIVKSAPSMFVPTMVGKVNQFQDSAVRETYSPDFMESVLNPSQAKISGQAQKLPQKVNTLGQPQTKENGIWDLFLNPATKTTYKPSPEAKEVMDLMDETGDERLAPHAVPKYITGKNPISKQDTKIMLTGKQLTEYQTIVGSETLRLLGQLPQNLSTERKVKRVLDILTKAGEKGRKDMRKSLNLR